MQKQLVCIYVAQKNNLFANFYLLRYSIAPSRTSNEVYRVTDKQYHLYKDINFFTHL